MSLGKQLAAVLVAPLSLLKLSGRAWGLFAVYLVLSSILLGLVGWQITVHEQDLKALFLAYLFPESWHFAGDLLIKYFLKSQTKEVLINASANGALVLVSLLLFPVKEKLSARFEEDGRLTDKPIGEFPLWEQGLEEVKLLVLYLTAYMLIFWVGYDPSPARKLTSTVLSHAFLFFSFSVDFIAPLLQRHQLHYSQIIKVLLKHPLVCFGFGAIFAAPSLVAGQLIKHQPEMSLATSVVLLFGATVIGMIWAAVSGTWVGGKLLDPAEATSRTAWPRRLLAWGLLLALFAWNSHVFASLGAALHHKSQILKCNYDVAWSSIGLDSPGGGGISGLVGSALKAGKTGQLDVGAHMTVNIENPTRFDVRLEKNRIEVISGSDVIATTRLSPMSIPAGRKVDQRLAFSVTVSAKGMAKGWDLVREKWRITLYLQITEGFEFPVYLLAPEGK